MSVIQNPYLDVVKARRDYRDFNWTRLEDLFEKSFAEKLIQSLVKEVSFRNKFLLSDGEIALSDEELASLSVEKKTLLTAQIHQLAANGEGFLFALGELNNSNDTKVETSLTELKKWLNSEATLELVSDITGVSGLKYTTLDAIRFSQGQFMADNAALMKSEPPKLGYMYDLTPGWNSNWGGLLHLKDVYEGAGITFTPVFNNMILFDAKQNFSITYLANFIKYNRYSMLGWFV